MSCYFRQNPKPLFGNIQRIAFICFILSTLWVSLAFSQSDDTIASTLNTPQPQLEKVTKIFSIQYSSASEIQNMAQALLSESGKMTRDDRTNLLVVIDTPAAIKRVEELITSVDIPLETLIIPVKYADVNEIARVVSKASPRSKINVDTRLNSIIVTDISSNIAQIKNIVSQMDTSNIQRPQIELDCGVIKVTLNEKNSTGIDWTKCPFIRKSSQSSTIYLENMNYEKMLEWLSKSGSADLLSRKRITVTPNEETRVREGIRYQTVEKQPMSMDTLGNYKFQMVTNREDFGFTYRFLAKPMDSKPEKRSLLLSFSVDGVLPQSGSTAAYSVNINNALMTDGITMVMEDIRRIPVINEQDSTKVKYDNLDLILLITPYSLEQGNIDENLINTNE